MAYTEPQKVLIRHYMGYSRLGTQVDPILENAIIASQSIVDGGGMPTSDTEAHVLSIITDLQALDGKLKEFWDQMIAIAIDGNSKVDVVRATAMMKQEGRRLVRGLSVALNTQPRRDVYSSAQPEFYG